MNNQSRSGQKPNFLTLNSACIGIDLFYRARQGPYTPEIPRDVLYW